ncbi:hypothetical protein GF374_00800 [Candidatus Woesearchaeota archaeon]|nr:hypothetical protein [Candidatus Woesearchaeota archaeon]
MRSDKEMDQVFQEVIAVLDANKVTPEEADALTTALDTLNESRIKKE